MRDAILMVDYGTVKPERREKTYQAMLEEVISAYPDHEVREAYVGEKIIKILKKRHGVYMDNTSQALERLSLDGYENVTILPVLMTTGAKFAAVHDAAWEFHDTFKSLKFAMPFMDSSATAENLIDMIEEIHHVKEHQEFAYVFAGHGSHHPADSAYAALDFHFKHRGMKNAFVATTDGDPTFDMIFQDILDWKPSKVVIIPLTVNLGEHFVKKINGDGENAWASRLKGQGIPVDFVDRGLLENPKIRRIFLDRIRLAEEIDVRKTSRGSNYSLDGLAMKILNAMPGLLVMIDHNLNVVHMNKAALDFFDISRSRHMLGEPVSQLMDDYAMVNMISFGRNMLQDHIYLENLQKHLDRVITNDKDNGLILCVMKDITEKIQRQDKEQKMQAAALKKADSLVEKQLRMVHEIASLLGETAADTKVAVEELKNIITMEEL